MKKIFAIRQIIVSFTAFMFLTWAFFKNGLLGKIIIIPFLICSFAMMMEKAFLLLNKIKISNIFKYVFRISFFVYVFGFLSYMIYYSITNKNYQILIIVAVFIPFVIHFLIRKTNIKADLRKICFFSKILELFCEYWGLLYCR